MHDFIELISQHNPTVDQTVAGYVTFALAWAWLILKIMK